MTLLQPWWLLLLPVWPLFILFLRARQQRRLVPVPDYLLWRRAAAKLPQAESHARLSWKDALWILPPVLLTLGLAKPELDAFSKPVPVMMLVDRSASMKTKAPDGSTRLERGLREARRLLAGREDVVESLAAPALVESATMMDAAGVTVMVVTDRSLAGLPPRVGLVQVVDDSLNAGIVSAGFDAVAGLLVAIEADPGSAPRNLTVTADGRVVEARALPAPVSTRIVLPPDSVSGAATVVVSLDSPDALEADDAVTLVRSRGPVRVSIAATAPASLDKALRAVPGVEIVRGGDDGGAVILVAPVAGAAGFETGPPAARDGALVGRSGFDGLTGPARWRAVHTLSKAPPGAETLLEAGAEPLLVRHGRTFVLLADPEENGWSSLPGFPLTIARIVEAAGAGAGSGLAVRPPAVLSPDETHVARSDPPLARAPAASRAPPVRRPLAPWIYGAAAVIMLALAFLDRRR